MNESDGWVDLAPSEDAGYNFSFATETDHDLEQVVAYAVAGGAEQAGYQPQETVRVMLDPAGHPFCLYMG